MLFSEFNVKNEQLQGLLKYKYSAATNSIIDNTFLLPAFWDFIQVRLPKTLSPNLITLTGFLANVFGFAALVFYSSALEDQRPYSLLLLAFVCGFFYNTCDNLDGKHARALGVGSVIGELFDHGLDSMANIFQLFPVVMALEMTKINFYVVLALFLLTDSYSLLFFSRKLAVGKIQFQSVDTTEIQYTSFLGILITVIFGYSFWDISIPVPSTGISLNLRTIFGLAGSFPLLSNSCVQIYQQLSSQKRINVYYVFVQCGWIWMYSVLMFECIPGAKLNCMPYFVMLGGCFSKLITETVFLSTGAEINRPWFRGEFLAPLFLFTNCYFNIVDPLLAVSLCATFTVFLWVAYFNLVVYKSARFLKLPVLTVPLRKLN